MLFVGDDWAEDHHDIEIVDEAGKGQAPGSGVALRDPVGG